MNDVFNLQAMYRVQKTIAPLAQNRWTMPVQNVWYTWKGTLNTIHLRQNI